MKQSQKLWAKSFAFSLLALAAVFLLMYALTGDFLRSVLAIVLVFLINKLFKKSNSLASMAMHHQVVEHMEDERP